MSEYDGVVYDLDGTLVRLDVDWDAVATDVAAVLADAGVDADGIDLWDMLDVADEAGVRGTVEATIADHERTGARTSRRLPFADDLVEQSVPSAVCSLNSESACHVALETHDLDGHVDAIVGRDSVGTYKPDPAPLLSVLESLSIPPERALFVGDSRRDEQTAERAGVSYEYVGDGPTTY